MNIHRFDKTRNEIKKNKTKKKLQEFFSQASFGSLEEIFVQLFELVCVSELPTKKGNCMGRYLPRQMPDINVCMSIPIKFSICVGVS